MENGAVGDSPAGVPDQQTSTSVAESPDIGKIPSHDEASCDVGNLPTSDEVQHTGDQQNTVSLVSANPEEDSQAAAAVADDDVTEKLDAHHAASTDDGLQEGFRLEKREETEQTSRTEELVEKPDGSEFRLHESKRLTLEEVTSKENERPATDEEIRALEQLQQQQQQQTDVSVDVTADDDHVVEISVGKEILVEEFKREESVHEEKVAGEPVNFVKTITEQHTTEEIQEPGSSLAVDLQPAVETVSEATPADDVEAVDGAKEESGEAVEVPPASVDEPASGASANDTEAAQSLVTSPSTDEIAARDRGTKSKGFIGFLKSRARSQSRERGDDQRDKKEPEEKKKSATLERDKSLTLEKDKKFKFNLFGKKGDEEKVEAASDDAKPAGENDKEAEKPKSLKKTLFGGKKNKDKSVADAGTEKKTDEKEKTVTAEDHVDESESKSKDRKWFHFGKKPAKEAQINASETAGEKADTTVQENDNKVQEHDSKPSKELAVEAENEQAAAPEEVDLSALAAEEVDGIRAEESAERTEEKTQEDRKDEPENDESVTVENKDEVEKKDEPTVEFAPENVEDSVGKEVEESAVEDVPEQVEDVAGKQAEEPAVEEVKETVSEAEAATEDSAAVENVVEPAQAESEVNDAKVDDAAEGVSPSSTLQRGAEADVKEHNKEQGGKAQKKFSFGFKFGKKQKTTTAGDGDLNNQTKDDGKGESADQETDPQAPEQPVKSEETSESAAETAPTKQSKMKLFSFGKKSKSKQKVDDEKEHKAPDAEQVEAQTQLVEQHHVEPKTDTAPETQEPVVEIELANDVVTSDEADGKNEEVLNENNEVIVEDSKDPEAVSDAVEQPGDADEVVEAIPEKEAPSAADKNEEDTANGEVVVKSTENKDSETADGAVEEAGEAEKAEEAIQKRKKYRLRLCVIPLLCVHG